MRDKLKFKDEEYFNAYIEKEKAYILDFQQDLKNGKVVERQINSVKGKPDNGLIFCGSNVSKIKEIVSVKCLMQELVCEL